MTCSNGRQNIRYQSNKRWIPIWAMSSGLALLLLAGVAGNSTVRADSTELGESVSIDELGYISVAGCHCDPDGTTCSASATTTECEDINTGACGYKSCSASDADCEYRIWWEECYLFAAGPCCSSEIKECTGYLCTGSGAFVYRGTSHYCTSS